MRECLVASFHYVASHCWLLCSFALVSMENDQRWDETSHSRVIMKTTVASGFLRGSFTWSWLHYVRIFAIANQIRLSSVCLSVTLVHPTQGVEPFGDISSPLCRPTLATLWPPSISLRRSFQGNPSLGGVKRRRGSKIERSWTYRMLYPMNGARYGLWYN